MERPRGSMYLSGSTKNGRSCPGANIRVSTSMRSRRVICTGWEARYGFGTNMKVSTRKFLRCLLGGGGNYDWVGGKQCCRMLAEGSCAPVRDSAALGDGECECELYEHGYDPYVRMKICLNN